MYCQCFFHCFAFLARLDEVQEELLYYPSVGVGVGVGGGVNISKMLKFYVKIFYVMGKAQSRELSCPCDRSCFYAPEGNSGGILKSLRPSLSPSVRYKSCLSDIS